MIKIAAVFGSPRRKGNTATLMHRAVEGARDAGAEVQEVVLRENWRAPSNEEKVMFSSAFSDAIMRPSPDLKPVKAKGKKTLQFNIQVPRIGKGYRVCVLGNDKKLGRWNLKEPLLLGCGNEFPTWKGSINLTGVDFPMHYKYGIYDLKKKEVEQWERNRLFL